MKNDIKVGLAFFILSIVTLESHSQEYVSMNFEEGFWNMEYFDPVTFRSNSQYYCKGDTLINDTLYSKLFSSFRYFSPYDGPTDSIVRYYVGAITELPNKTVRYIPKDESISDKIYDFNNIEIGDTIECRFMSIIVNGIDSVEYCGKYHKRYYENIDIQEYTIALIEGIGYSNGLLGYYVGAIGSGETTVTLSCYFENGNPKCSNCGRPLEIELNPLVGKAYPNPACDIITFELSHNMLINSQIVIYDQLGRCVYSKEEINSNQVIVDVSQYDPGLYFYKLQNEGNRTYASGQFVVE